MTTTLQASQVRAPGQPRAHTAPIAEKAMLVELSIYHWGGHKKDKRTTQDVTTQAHAEEGAGSWWTRVVPPESLKKIEQTMSMARGEHNRMTLPWSDSGPRILPSKRYFDYKAMMREMHQKFETAVEEFLAEYPKLVAEAPKRLNGLFDVSYFPSVNDLRGRFRFVTSTTPLPQSADFRVDLGSDVVEEIRASIDSDYKEAINTAMGDLWGQLYEVVAKIAERLGDPDAIIRESVIENAKELCGVLPKMNITDDPRLEEMRAQVLTKLAGIDPKDVRKNKAVRADKAKEAKAILDKMAGFMGAK